MESLLPVAVAGAAFFLLKALLFNDLSSEKVRAIMKEGAVIIDVRTGDEYEAAHLKPAINIPLNEIGSNVQMQVPDRHAVILLYCRSGSRSFAAKRVLKHRGYSNVYNLGSFRRAKRMINYNDKQSSGKNSVDNAYKQM